MKKAVFFLTVLSVLSLGAYICEAGDWWAYYPNIYGYPGDDSRVVDRFSWDGNAHLAITWNNTTFTASAIEMDPDGRPRMYYWADVYPTYYDLWYSRDGVTWYHYGSYIY